MLRFMTAGESHGPCITAVLDGFPAGVPVDPERINRDLARRQMGYGRGRRMAIEKDQVEIRSGVRWGETMGSPITLVIENRDWKNWEKQMSPLAQDSGQAKPVTRPRPGHADLAGALKFGHRDVRNVLERASARETVARVAVGAVAKCLLERFSVLVGGWVAEIGGVVASTEGLDFPELLARAERSKVGMPDPRAEEEVVELIDRCAKEGDTLGGVVETRATGLPPGLGSHTQWDRKLDGRLAQAVMSVQSVKGVEIGLGFGAARKRGSEVHDEIGFDSETREFTRHSNNAGGTEGGMTSGAPVVVRAALKPISTLMRPLRSVDLVTKEEVKAAIERSDVCAVPAGAVIVEAVVAFTLAQAFLEKFGGDSLVEIRRNYEGYLRQVREF